MPTFGDLCAHLVSTLSVCLLLTGCVKGQCQLPSVKPGMELADKGTGMDNFPEGSSVTLQCRKGYSKTGGSGVINCINAVWTTETLQCEKISCGSPGEILNGKFSTPEGIEFGATAYASCDRGYELVPSNSYRQCFDEGWSNRLPTCDVKKCEDPTPIDNGQITSQPNKRHYVYREIVTYTCNENYNLIGNSQLVCNEHGNYSGTVPHCQELNCPTPRIENAVRTDGPPPPYELKNFVVYECKDGYEMTGSSKLVCEATGWSSEFPNCTKEVNCPTPKIENAVLTEGSPPPYKLNAFVVYKCKDDYVMKGSSKLVCERTGWSSEFPTCTKEVNCPTPKIENAVLTEGPPPPYKLNASVVYKCEEGYEMKGSSKLVCEATGWSAKFPTCTKHNWWSLVWKICLGLGAVCAVGFGGYKVYKHWKNKR